MFGPGPACGLCSLFPLGHHMSSFVTLELVLTQPDHDQYDYIEIEVVQVAIQWKYKLLVCRRCPAAQCCY